MLILEGQNLKESCKMSKLTPCLSYLGNFLALHHYKYVENHLLELKVL